jgi:hypothetical protein
MAKNQNKNLSRARAGLAAIFSSGALLASGGALATPETVYASHGIDPIDIEFRKSHPLRVYVNVEADRNRRETDPATSYVRQYLDEALPRYVLIVNDRRSADMIVRAGELSYDLSFHVTDVDQRNKKYKKKYRYAGGKCGVHQRAFYSRIEEKGVALTDYTLSVRLRDVGSYNDTIHIRADEKFRYGENLRAQTNCGIKPTTNYPNSAVAQLFARSNPNYRQTVAFEIRKEATQKLARVIANEITNRTEQHYATLATKYSYSSAMPASFNRSRGHVPANIYDHDEDAVYKRGEYIRFRPGR